ncbi:LLM class flavin-dependent oxidoreductase [Dactylosporangium vinaceum]|uniref:LLM class flavin-dependent oxidoreductase n=1 Tax=Dactylosporangium vinaceum TaxID=53362 RepID=A0ABV5MMN5_9ACTN|nr:LLM class flavin-dependent oxidoreductase [Dactylosporangium vinaceum]UAB92278.1 LLM class flavin-dependent oxidoreductase [Dactylosporangium vinaceum]
MTNVPLSILDLAPISSGSDAGAALRTSIDVARRADALGYTRYWVAEHHFARGVAGAAPAVLIGLIAAATDRIRVGSGAVQVGYQTPLSVVEQFGIVDALHPGRIDLGLGRSGGRPTPVTDVADRVVDGLLIPAPFDFSTLAAGPRFAAYATLLRQPGAEPAPFPSIVDDLQALIAGTLHRAGYDVHATPGEGAKTQLWVLGSSGGESARVAGERGLPFAANYHVAPSNVLEAVEAYRSAFRPGVLDRPYVMVSADVLVAGTAERAAHLGSPFRHWVRSIRTGTGAIPYPTPAEAAALPWSDADQALVRDRLDTRFVGTADAVAERLQTLRRVTQADELLVTTITHDPADRLRSFELLAEAWLGA